MPIQTSNDYKEGESMTLSEMISPFTTILKILLTMLRKDSNRPSKRLEAHLVMRGIVSELPDDIPFHICDENGVRYKGVYAIGLFIWNKGNQPVVMSDLLPSSPLQVTVGSDATLISARAIPAKEDTDCAATIINQHTLTIAFDCLNPKEYLVLPLIVTGNPMTEVAVTGRIVGQVTPIDHTAEEVRASAGERFISFLILILIANAFPGFLIGGWIIFRDYGIFTLQHNPESIPTHLMLSFIAGVAMFFLFALSRVVTWCERKKFPEGYPLYADLEPPLLENIRGMLRTVFQGKKQRVSASLFDWGKPVLMRDKKSPKLTINDWIR